MCLHSMVISAIILKLIDDILVAVDMKLGVVILIIELSAGFDIVDHKVLWTFFNQNFKLLVLLSLCLLVEIVPFWSYSVR